MGFEDGGRLKCQQDTFAKMGFENGGRLKCQQDKVDTSISYLGIIIYGIGSAQCFNVLSVALILWLPFDYYYLIFVPSFFCKGFVAKGTERM